MRVSIADARFGRRSQEHASKVMLVSPSLDGHRAVYVQELTQDLAELGYESSLWTLDRDGLDWLPESVRMRAIRDCSPLELRDTRILNRRAVDLGVQSLFFAEGDLHLGLLSRQLLPDSPRLAVGRVALFLRGTRHKYSQWYLDRGGQVRCRLKAHVDRHSVQSQFFHEVAVPHLRVLDAALYLDEWFVSQRQSTRRWMPDIFESSMRPSDAEHMADAKALRQLNGFLAGQGERPVFVYYGRAQQRRGYGDLLELAADTGGVFVHVGPTSSQAEQTGEKSALMQRLRHEGRLFETHRPLAGFDAAKGFFAPASCVVLPYRNHFGSSGVMLQALAAGRPVLVPDVGLMAQRVRAYGLGLTYRHGSFQDMVTRWRDLNASGSSRWQANLEAFVLRFSTDARRRAIAGAMASVREAGPQ